MKLSTSGLVHQADEGDRKCLNSELWHACAGPLVSLPTLGSCVVYFPQGHSEQVVATTNKEIDAHIPNYPNLPAQLICQLHNVTMHADVETDEVYGQMTLQPLSLQEQKDAYLPVELGAPNRQPTNYFCKTLTASDTSTYGAFSVPRLAAEKVFPPLDFSQTHPCQELIARDLHDVEWKFRHIFRGEPKRHLLTTGWSVFVSAKRLVAGDSVLFIWNEKNQLLLGIRRALRPQTVMPSSVLSSDSMHIGLLVAAAHARHTRLTFDRIGTENQHHHHQHLDHDHQLQHPHQPSMKERTMDVMSVVGALLFGMGCGALTAATKYLVWSLCVPNRFDDEEEEEEVEFDEDLYNTKKIAQNGYVAVANDVVVDDQVHGGGVGKEGE